LTGCPAGIGSAVVFRPAAVAALIVLAFGAQPGAAAPPSLGALDPKVISYFPATGGWTTMWDHWNPARYRTDLGHIAALGATSVRIIVPAGQFGFPEPAEPYVSRLHDLIGIAASQGLTVQLTLFDWLDEQEYGDIAGSEQWAHDLLAPYAGDRRIAFVEVRNEIDPGDPQAMAWARQLIPYVRDTLLDAVPVTISVAGADPAASVGALKAALAGAEPDFYTIHYYGGDADRAYWTLQAAQQAVAPVPLWIGETGYPTSTSTSGYFEVPSTQQAQEAAQVHFLKTVAYAAQELGMPPPGVWTLSDFDAGTIPAASGVQKEPEYDFGLFRTNGSAKPAAAVVRAIFAGTPPASFNGDFEHAVTAVGGGTQPAEWSAVGSANAQLAEAHDAPHGGSGDAVVRSLDGAPAQGTFWIAPVASTPPAGALHADASVWARVSAPGSTVRIELDWLDATGAEISTQDSHPGSPRHGWTQLRVSAAPPPGARSVRILLCVAGDRGSVWLDDVAFDWR
jgi:hypothetical protein